MTVGQAWASMDTLKDEPGLKTLKVPSGMDGRRRLAITFLMLMFSLSPVLQDAKAAEKAAKKAKAAAKLQAAKEAKEAEATRGTAGTRKSKAKAEADVKKVRRIRAQPDCSDSQLYDVGPCSRHSSAFPAA